MRSLLPTLAALLVTMTLGACGQDEPSAPPPRPTPIVESSAPPPARATLRDLPRGPAPRIGYVERRTWVAPDGRRTRLPTQYGISGIVPYAGGFLVSDMRWFEGTVGLWFVTEQAARGLPGCSSGVPRRANGWVWWVIGHCPESLDLVSTEIHWARPDGSDEHVRVLRARPNENLVLTTNEILDQVAPQRNWVREDARHRLAVVHRGGWTAIVRRDVDGNRELATQPIRDDGRPGYVLGPGR